MRVLVICAQLMYMAATANAQLPHQKVSDEVKRIFDADFPGVSRVGWIERPDAYIVSFRQGEVRRWAAYSKAGQRIYYTKLLPIAEMPPQVRDSVRRILRKPHRQGSPVL